jgi:hypothetical protein
MGKTAIAVEDMRSVEPAAYIRAVGLRPEDSYGFLPIDLHDTTSYFFLYRDRPEYEERRPALPGAESVRDFGPFEVYPTQNVSGSQDIEKLPEGMQGGLNELIASAQEAQQAWADQGVAGGPNESEADRIARIDKLKEIGAIDQAEYDNLVSEVRGGDAGPTPGGADAAPAPKGAPDIVVQRVYPGLRMRSSTKQLDDFMPDYAEALGLCPEDVYGVYPRSTRTSSTAESSSTEWDDFWIVYRDRPEYAAGREGWAKKMNKKGRWPEAEVYPGVAEPSSAAYERPKIQVEKDRWPREKMVMKKQGSDLADALREKIGKWGYEPEDSYGFCPDYDGGAIYFAWRKR